MIDSGASRSKKSVSVRSLLAGSVSALALGTAGMLGSTTSAEAVFDRYVLVQPIQVCDDAGLNCAVVDYFHAGTAAALEQAGVLPIFLPLSQHNESSVLVSNSGPSSFDSGDGGSGDPLTINMWFTALSSIDNCGGSTAIGCASTPGREIVIDSQALLNEAAGNGGDPYHRTIAHEIGHSFGLPHVSGMGFSGNLLEVPNTVNRTGTMDEIGVDRFLLTAGQITSIRGDAKAQTAVDCLGDGGANAINLVAGSACLNIFAQAGNDVITLNFGSGVLQDLQGGAGDDLIAVLNGSIVGDNVEGGSGNDLVLIGGLVMDDVLGGSGSDYIELTSTSQVVGNVDGGSDGDTILIGGLIIDGGNVFGGSGGDYIELLSTAQVTGNVDGESGNDMIVIAADPADILGGTGDDVIILNTGAVADNVYGDDNDGFEGDDGNDVIIMNDGTVIVDVAGEGGNDVIRIFGGSIGGNVEGNGGTDILEIAGGSIGGNVAGGNGEDVFDLSGGNVSGDVSGGNDDDVFVLTGTSISGDLSGGNGEDSFTISGGSVGDEVSGGNNDDVIVMTAGFVGGDLSGGNGNDDISISGGTVGGDVEGGNNSDTFLMTGGLISGGMSGGNHNDVFTLSGGSISANVTGGNGSDTITLFGTSIGGNVDGGNNNDEIVMTAGSVDGNVSGGFDDDLIQVLGGTVFGSVFGNEGNDVILTAEPGTVLGNVDGGEDDDIITIASDPVDVLGGTGDDVINIVAGAVVTGSVYGDDNDGFEGDDGNDFIGLSGGIVNGGVFGEGGNDLIGLSGSLVLGGLWGGGGNDGLLITGGATSLVSGGAGNDIALWNGGTITTFVDMGTGTDVLDIYGVNAGGTAFQAGLTVLDGGDDASSADGQIDTLNLRGVVEVLTDLQNWEFINLVDTSLGDLGQASRTIVTEQFYVEAGSALIATGNFGSTQTYVIDGDLLNGGIVHMRDGAPSYDELVATGIYTGGAGSVLSTDSFLGGLASPSDLMVVGTATAGNSALFVFDTNAGPGAYNPDGIPVVDVSAGTTDENHFTLVNGFTGLAGPIDKGLFFYDLALRPDNVHVLIGVPDLEAFQLARIPTQAQSAWHTSTGVWLDRSADLRAHLDGSAAPGAEGPVSPGFWVRGVGSFMDREDSASITLFNKTYDFDTSYDQVTYGALWGGDWAWNNVFGPGDAAVLGAFVGYVGWDAWYNEGNGRVDAGGLSTGVYTTWLNQGFFVDGVFKADLPKIEVTFPGLAPYAPTADTIEARSLGGVLDTGYRHQFGQAWYVEGLGTFSYLNVDMDPAGLAGSVVAFGEDQSLRGRLGLAFGGTFQMGNVATLVSRLSASAWHEFEGDNGTDFLSPGGAPLAIHDDFSGTFGEVSAVVDVFGNNSGVTMFLKTDYRFGEDTNEFAGSLGLKYTP